MNSIYNTNYIYNTKNNPKKIKKMVLEIMKEPVNPQTLDFLFRYNTRNYPITVHYELDLPGEFEEMKDTAVFVVNENAKQMDYLESVKPDNKMVKRDAANSVEQFTGILKNPKIREIFNYCLYTTITLKRPCYAIVATDHDYGKEYEDYDIEGFSFRIYFRTYNKNKIYKLLNNLKRKDYSKEKLSNREYIQLIYCLIFAKKDFAKDVIRQITHLFATMENMDFNHQFDLYLALKMMIKFRFKDDLEQKEELLTMIIKSIHESKHEEITGYEVKQKSIEELKEELKIKDNIITEQDTKLQEKDTKLQEKDNIITEQDTKLQEKDNIITDKDNIITDKDNTIMNLRKILLANNLLKS